MKKISLALAFLTIILLAGFNGGHQVVNNFAEAHAAETTAGIRGSTLRSPGTFLANLSAATTHRTISADPDGSWPNWLFLAPFILATLESGQRQNQKKKLTKLGIVIASGILAIAAGYSGYRYFSSTPWASEAEYLQRAKQFQSKGEIASALIEAKNALQKNPSGPQPRLLLANLYGQIQDYPSAEKELRKSRELGAPPERVLPQLAATLISMGEFQRVLDEVNAEDGLDKKTQAAVHSARGNAYLGLGQAADAEKAFNAADQALPNSPDTALGRAKLALLQGKTEDALSLVESALRQNENHVDAWLAKGDLLQMMGKTKEAVSAYQKATAIEPGNARAHLSLATLYLAAQNFNDAKRAVDAAARTSPNTVSVRYMRALLAFRQNDYKQANEHLSSILRIAPQHLPSQQLAGAVSYSLGNYEQANTHLGRVLASAPRNAYVRKLMAATQLKLKQPREAMKTLQAAGLQGSQDAGLLVLAGEASQAMGDYDQATEYYSQAAKGNPDNAELNMRIALNRMAGGDIERGMHELEAVASQAGDSIKAAELLALAQIQRKEYDRALNTIAGLEKKQPNNPMFPNLRGTAWLAKKDSTRARAGFDKALSIKSDYFPAAANLARLDMQDNNPAAAKKRFQTILSANPKHVPAMLAMAELAAKAGDEKGYVSWLEKAANTDKQAIQPRLLLARHLLSKKENAKALSAARDAVNTHPDNPLALDLLGTTQLASGDKTNALETYRKLAGLVPNQAGPKLRVAQIQAATKQTSEARKTLLDALRIQPDLLEAKSMLGGLEIQAARYDEALKLARQIQQENPDSPAGPMLEGDIALTRKQYVSALAAYERAHKLAPSGAALSRQHQALAGMQRSEDGEKRLASWLSSHPQDGRTRLYLAERLNSRGQYKQASDHYLILNQQNPGNLVVINNLAWALQGLNDPRALGYAEQAYKLRPDDPAVMDTLGWLLIQKGQAERGTKMLQQALSKAPDAAEIQYHLALAYKKIGDHTKARRELERLLASGLAFPREQEAHALLKQLQGNGQ